MSEKVMIRRVPDEQIDAMHAYLIGIDAEIELDQRHMHTLSKVLAGYDAAWTAIETKGGGDGG